MAKSSNLILLVLVLLAVIAGGLLLWPGQDPDAGLGPDAPLMMADAALESAEADLVEGEGGFEAEEETETEESGSYERTQLGSMEDGRPLHLQVWHGEAGVPAAGAEVFVIERDAMSGRSGEFDEHWTAVCEDEGERFEADAQGWVELPPVRDRVYVVARDERSFGQTRLDLEHDEVETITLQRDETVTIRVMDGAGQPVLDAPVGIVQTVPERASIRRLEKQLKDAEGHIARVERWKKSNPEQSARAQSRLDRLQRWQKGLQGQLRKAKDVESRQGPEHNKKQPVIITRYELRARRLTDEEGYAQIRHFQIFRRDAGEWWPLENSNQFEAALLMPMAIAQTVPFAGKPVPEGVIELRLPPTGSVALRTIDRDGRPFTHPVRGELLIEGMDSKPWMRIPVRKEQGEEAVLFPFVGLGLQFRAHCRLDDDDFRWTVPSFVGPRSPGELVSIDLVVAPEQGMLIGRVMDEDGAALGGQEVTFLINSQIGRLEGEEVPLDEDGSFHLPYKVSSRHKPPFRLEIRHERPGPTAGLVMELQELPEAKVTDLGDLQVSALSRIAYGRVVDDLGEPIAEARVRLQRERPYWRNPREMRFANEPFVETRSAIDGSFDLFADAEPGKYRLRVDADEHFGVETPELRIGEVVDVRLQRLSQVLGTVSVPEWMARKDLRVRLLAQDGKLIREVQIHELEGQASIQFERIWPGRYDVAFRVREFPDPFLRIEGIELEAGQQDVHPRLENIDLAAYLYHFEVRAVKEDGAGFNPDRPLLASIQRPDGRRTFVGFPWRKGRVELLSADRQIEVVPLASGRHAQRTLLVAGLSELRFSKVAPFVLQLAGMRQLVGDTKVQILLEPVGESELPDKLEEWDRSSERMSKWYGRTRKIWTSLNAKDLAWFRPTAAGRYRTRAMIGYKSGVKPVQLALGQVELKMQSGEKAQRIQLRVDAARVQQAMSDLSQRLAAKAAGG